MITNIKINGFKSFQDFEMEFAPFTVIAGANASGKSNLFDALMLLARLAETDNLKKAFKEQRGEFIELFTQHSENEYATQMQFCVEMVVNNDIKDGWGNDIKLEYTKLRYELHIERFTNSIGMEEIKLIHEQLTNKNDEDFYIESLVVDRDSFIQAKENNQRIRFLLKNATRTVLSSFDTIDFPHILAAREEMKSWKLLQLNPKDLRNSTSKEDGTDIISQSGKNLAAVLHRIKQEDDYNLIEISRKLQKFIPQFIEVISLDDKENRSYSIKLKDSDKKIYSAKILSEGTLRILALCILEYDSKSTGLLCFEEPENGIHPAHIKNMVELLKDLSVEFDDKLRQVIVNTHSPILVAEVINSILENDNEENNRNCISINLFRTSFLAKDTEKGRIGIVRTNVQNLFSEQKIVNQDNLLSQIDIQNNKKRVLYTINEYLATTNFDSLHEKLEQIKQNNIANSIND